jgi:hypothetical protein
MLYCVLVACHHGSFFQNLRLGSIKCVNKTNNRMERYFLPALRGKNCVGDYEDFKPGPRGEGKSTADDCKQMCKDEPMCKYAVLNQYGACYVKGSHSQKTRTTCLDAPGQDSYKKRQFNDEYYGDWKHVRNNCDFPSSGANNVSKMIGQMPISDCVSLCMDDPLCRIAVVKSTVDESGPDFSGYRTCYHRSKLTNDTNRADEECSVDTDWYSYVKP